MGMTSWLIQSKDIIYHLLGDILHPSNSSSSHSCLPTIISDRDKHRLYEENNLFSPIFHFQLISRFHEVET